MNTRRQHDFDDGFDEESLFEDEEYRFEQLPKRAGLGAPAKARSGPQDREDRLPGDKANRRRDFAGTKAWRTQH